MMKPFLTVLFLVAATACHSQEGHRATPPTLELEQARARMAEGRVNEALLITDGLLAADKNNRDALLLAADGNVAIFESERAGQEHFLSDAITNLQSALELDGNDPENWERLSGLHLANAEFVNGVEAALRAADLYTRRKADTATICRAVLAAADNEMQIFVDARRPELEQEEDLQPATAALAQAVLVRVEFARRGLPGPASIRAGRVHQWLQ